MVAQSDCGDEAWRRRQIYSISSRGSLRVLGTSMNDDRVLMPGGFVDVDVWDGPAEMSDVCPEPNRGGGGGGGKGKFDGGRVAVGEDLVTTPAFCFTFWILSL